MKEFKVNIMLLKKHYVIVFLGLILSSLLALLIGAIFTMFLKFHNTTFIVFVFLSMVFYLWFIDFFKSFYIKRIILILDTDKLIVEGLNKDDINIELDQVEQFNYKYQFKNYPIISIKLKNKKRIKFHCFEKCNEEVEEFVYLMKNSLKNY